MVVGSYVRQKRDLLAPFTPSGRFAGLTVEHCAIDALPHPAWVKFEKHGDKDVRVPISQGYELYNALKRQGVPVKMVVYPRQPHGLQEPKMQLDAMQRNVEWFDQQLAKSRTP